MHLKPTIRLALAAGTLGVLLTSTACTNESSKSDAPSAPVSAAAPAITVDAASAALVPADIKAKGDLVYVHDASYPPFEYFDTDNKTIIGFDVDLSDAISATLGLKATHVNAGFDTILAGIASHKYDAGVSAFSVTPQRAATVDFVNYLDAGSGIAVKKGNPLKLAMDPMLLCGHNIAGEKGTVQGLNQLPAISAACEAAGKRAISIQLYPSQSEANLSLTSGRADAVMADAISLTVQAAASAGQFELAPGAAYKPAPVGIALAKGSPLDAAVSSAVKHLFAGGQMDPILAKWSIPKSDVNTALAGTITK